MPDHADMLTFPATTLEWKGLSWLPPGPRIASFLSGPLDDLTDTELIEVAAAARRQTSWTQSRELAAIAELSRRRDQAEQDGDSDYRILSAHESVCQEISAALTITPDSAANLIDLAGRLAEDLPDTRQALEAGRIDLPRARVIAELSHGLAPELCQRLEERALPAAEEKTPDSCAARSAASSNASHPNNSSNANAKPSRTAPWDCGTSPPAPRT
jgi:hypothetical protein